jgi:hypothetical protein
VVRVTGGDVVHLTPLPERESSLKTRTTDLPTVDGDAAATDADAE